jgi:hypothetical protein
MSLRKRQDLGKAGYEGELRIKESERLSERPFGEHTRKGRFILDIDKVPFYNIPDLTGFNLKPYVSHATGKIDPKTFEERKIHLTDDIKAEIKTTIENLPKEEVALHQSAQKASRS